MANVNGFALSLSKEKIELLKINSSNTYYAIGSADPNSSKITEDLSRLLKQLSALNNGVTIVDVLLPDELILVQKLITNVEVTKDDATRLLAKNCEIDESQLRVVVGALQTNRSQSIAAVTAQAINEARNFVKNVGFSPQHFLAANFISGFDSTPLFESDELKQNDRNVLKKYSIFASALVASFLGFYVFSEFVTTPSNEKTKIEISVKAPNLSTQIVPPIPSLDRKIENTKLYGSNIQNFNLKTKKNSDKLEITNVQPKKIFVWESSKNLTPEKFAGHKVLQTLTPLAEISIPVTFDYLRAADSLKKSSKMSNLEYNLKIDQRLRKNDSSKYSLQRSAQRRSDNVWNKKVSSQLQTLRKNFSGILKIFNEQDISSHLDVSYQITEESSKLHLSKLKEVHSTKLNTVAPPTISNSHTFIDTPEKQFTSNVFKVNGQNAVRLSQFRRASINQIDTVQLKKRFSDLLKSTNSDLVYKFKEVNFTPKKTSQLLKKDIEDPLTNSSPLIRPLEISFIKVLNEPTISSGAVPFSTKPESRPVIISSLSIGADKIAVAKITRGPQFPISASVSKNATTKNIFELNRTNLLGTFGTEKDPSALIKLASGEVIKVRVGDRFSGWRVFEIHKEKILLRNGRVQEVLRIPG